MKTLIAGCGYIGMAFGQEMVLRGNEVWGLRRTIESDQERPSAGVKLIQADLLDPQSLVELPSVDLIVLCQAPSKKTDDYAGTYLQGTKNLLSAYQSRIPKKIIFVSSTSVYSTHDGSWVDESTDPMIAGYESEESKKNASILLQAEREVLACGASSNVFRLSGIYGPARHRLRALKEGKMKPSFSETYTNRIHRDDIVSGLLLIMEKGGSGGIYIGADDHPSTQKEFYSWICEKLNLSFPTAQEPSEKRMHVSNRRCSNKKIKELGLRLKFPSFREGYAEIIGELKCR